MRLERHLFRIVAAELVAAGAGLIALGVTTPRYVHPPIAVSRAAASQPARVSCVAVPRSDPVSVAIPALGISSRLGPARGLNPTGVIDDAPLSGPSWSLPWWYKGGPSPGQQGSAVLLGHVDSAIGTGHLGVLFRLGHAAPGDAVITRLSDGVLARWTIASTAVYKDGDFPDSVVYKRTGCPTLRLVTCGGRFDWRTHQYQSAVVVTAVQISSGRLPAQATRRH